MSDYKEKEGGRIGQSELELGKHGAIVNDDR